MAMMSALNQASVTMTLLPGLSSAASIHRMTRGLTSTTSLRLGAFGGCDLHSWNAAGEREIRWILVPVATALTGAFALEPAHESHR
jgi:hypothetical protein